MDTTSLLALIRRRYRPLHRFRDTRFGRVVLDGVLDREVCVRLPGLAFKVDVNLGSHLGYCLAPKSMEAGITRYLIEAFSNGTVGKFFDVGANFGYYVWLAHTIDPSIECVAVDPEPDNVARLSATARRSPGPTTVVQAAASSRLGTATFVRDALSGFRGTLEGEPHLRPADGHGVRAETIDVDAVTLDALAAEHGVPDLIKIDVEGHELAVLDGAEGLLRTGATLLIEVTDTSRTAVFERLRGFGYSVAAIEPPAADLATASDVLAVRTDHALPA